MHRATAPSRLVSRRRLLGATASVVGAAAISELSPSPALAASVARQTARRAGSRASPTEASDPLFRMLDEKIEAAMARYHIPGVAVGVLHNGQEYVRGYGVTNVDYPQPVDGDTLFRIGSTTKTFTGTTVMRLVEQGMLDLNAPVRTYLPALQLADESVAARVTVRQLLNHSAGWLGDYFAEQGRGEDALARYVAGMQQLPQLTPLGQMFAYNNAAVTLAGHVVATVAGKPYEAVVQELLLDPLGLTHSGFFTDTLVGYNLAACHDVVDDQAVVQPPMWTMPRTLNPTGGLISSARDQLRYARFHLGDGTADDGTALLTPQSLAAMRSDPGPGGTIAVEIDGIGVTWMLRRTAEGVRVVQHGGDWAGQHSGFFFVPERGFAMTALTNSEDGSKLTSELFGGDWALRQFVGLSDPPAVPRALPPAQLAQYEGYYRGQILAPPGGPTDEALDVTIELSAADGGLRARLTGMGQEIETTLAFYRDDFVLVTDDEGQSRRADFVRGPDGRVAWYRDGGRIHAYQG